jgi:hypothetical protein
VIRSDIVWQRLHNERLLGAPFATPERAVAWLGAVQAQDYSGAKWAIGQRIERSSDAVVERAFQRGRILRTHVLRPTWHFVMPADIRWMLELTAPRIRALMAHYDRKLELDAKLVRRSNAALVRALRGNSHLTREELAAVLSGIGIHAKGQRLGHLVMHAELDAAIVSGPRRGKQFTYALFDERVPAQKRRSGESALAELTKRYFQSHGPALLQDFAWWSGLKVSDAKAGVEMVTPRLEKEQIDGKTYWFAPFEPKPRAAEPTVHLLPNYDEYLISYKDYAPVTDPKLFAGLSAAEKSVLFNHLVVRNGQVIGGWRRSIEKDAVDVELRLLTTLKRAERSAIRKAAERYAQFLGLPLRLGGFSTARAF